MLITGKKIIGLLKKENLYKEIIQQNEWHYEISQDFQSKEFTKMSYDSRLVDSETLFFVKGANFKEEFLKKAIDQESLEVYISEVPFDFNATAIIVEDVKKAMSVLAQAFYDYPQEKLKLIAFTGTKGKTTAAYFTKSILDQNPSVKCAMLSTMNSTLDGTTYFKSQLTTPESLDLFEMMHTAVENQMTHFIMEVSSQAYKTNRVYGLLFDVGVFLNISPDHIGPIEHPNFEDYFYCKRQLLKNSKNIILNKDMDYFELLLEEVKTLNLPYFVYGNQKDGTHLFFESKDALNFMVQEGSLQLNADLFGEYQIQLIGEFNKGNALAAMLSSYLTGVNKEEIYKGLSLATVPGRMEMLTQKNGAKIYIDYAHNKVSLNALIDVVRENHQGKIIVVIGSTGNKAESRRQDFGEVLSEKATIAVLTSDDPNYENPMDIAKEIEQSMPVKIETYFEMDRKKAIELAFTFTANEEDALILAAKGADLYQVVNGKKEDYEGDFQIAKNLI